jgi:hypothetical protein
MKLSEFKQIIKEEIKAVLELDGVNRTINDKFKAAMKFTSPEGGPGNKMGLPLEKLQTYNDLPETDREVPKKDMRYIDTFIILPSVSGENGFIYSKEKAKKWLDAYKAMYKGEEPRFKTKRISIAGKDNIVSGEIISSEYLEHQQKMKDYEKSPEYHANVQSFYDKLKYKGD